MTLTGVQPLEQLIAQGAIQTVGDPVYLGIMVLLFFVGFVCLQNVSLSGKAAILVPAFILSLAFIPAFAVIGGLLMSGVLYLGLTKFLQR